MTTLPYSVTAESLALIGSVQATWTPEELVLRQSIENVPFPAVLSLAPMSLRMILYSLPADWVNELRQSNDTLYVTAISSYLEPGDSMNDALAQLGSPGLLIQVSSSYQGTWGIYADDSVSRKELRDGDVLSLSSPCAITMTPATRSGSIMLMTLSRR